MADWETIVRSVRRWSGQPMDDPIPPEPSEEQLQKLKEVMEAFREERRQRKHAQSTSPAEDGSNTGLRDTMVLFREDPSGEPKRGTTDEEYQQTVRMLKELHEKRKREGYYERCQPEDESDTGLLD